jgi:hypothetical protein
LDSTAKLLKELPLEVASSHGSSNSAHSTSSHSSNNDRRRNSHIGDNGEDDEGLPSLQYYDPYIIKNEFHPRVVLKKISEGSLDFLVPIHDASGIMDGTDVEEFFEEESDSLKEFPVQVPCNRWEILSPGSDGCKNLLSPTRLGKINNAAKGRMPSDQLKIISCTVSPRTLVDFPLPPLKSTEHCSQEQLNETLQSAGQLLGS